MQKFGAGVGEGGGGKYGGCIMGNVEVAYYEVAQENG